MKYLKPIQGDTAPTSAEQLSALFDGHLCAEQTAALVRQSLADDSLMLQWRSMSAIGRSMHEYERAYGREGERTTQAMAPLVASPTATPMPAPHPPQEAANDSVFRWKMVAGVAGMAAVGSLVWGLLGQQSAQLPSAVLAQQGTGAVPAASLANTQASANRAPDAGLVAVQASPDAPVMIRDPRLDELLAAHRQFGGVSALQQPAGSLRSASLSTNRP